MTMIDYINDVVVVKTDDAEILNSFNYILNQELRKSTTTSIRRTRELCDVVIQLSEAIKEMKGAENG